MREHDEDLDIGQLGERALSMVKKQRWWLLIAACGVALGSAVVASGLPARYTSKATLVVTQPLVPARYVEPGTTASVADAVNAVTREILSRNRLLAIIEEMDLYPEQREGMPPEIMVGRMLGDVEIVPLDIGPGGNFSAFEISYIAERPLTAQRVTSRLASFFIEENLRRQGSQAQSTANFLSEQLEEARKKLEAQEQRLQQYKINNLGELPEQTPLNMASLGDLRSQLQRTQNDMARAEQQRASLDARLRANLARLQSEKQELLERYTARHPEVAKKDAQIAKSQAWLKRLLSGERIQGSPAESSSLDDPELAQIESEVDSIAADMASLTVNEKQVKAEIAQFQRRLNLAPVKDQELTEIERDYELLKQNYNDLLNKQLDSQLTINLEERQQGRQFRIVDPPTLPVLPSSPNRLRISLSGAGLGLLLGLALAFLREITDDSFRSEKDLGAHFGAPLILSLPVLLTPAEERTRKWGRALEWVAASVMMMTVIAAEMYVLRRG